MRRDNGGGLVHEEIHLGPGFAIDAPLFDILRHPDDGEPRKLLAAADPQPFADRILALPERVHDGFVDDRHHRGGEDNGDAHLKNLLVHHQVIVPVTGGRLDLGPWQAIFYVEFDGRRNKRLVIKAMGE